jgi:transposase
MDIFCGIDWAESHHDVAVVDDTGQRLAKQRISDDLAGFTALTALLADLTAQHLGSADPVPLDIALETDRGLLVAGLRAAGHRVYAINPKAVDRYRDRHATSRAKSDAGDALVLAELLRTDRHVHRQLPRDSDLSTAIGVLSRTHQDTVWRQRIDGNRLRSLLREYFPAALSAFPDLTTRTAQLVLTAAPTPTLAAALTEPHLLTLLHQAGRGTLPTHAARLRQIFTAPQLHQPPQIEQAMGTAALAIVATLSATSQALRELEQALKTSFEQHPDAEILTSLPGLGLVLGARMIGEQGDDPTRFVNAASRRAYAGTSPITRASGKSRVVLRRNGNRRLTNACRLWAFSALTSSTGARAHYDRRRATGDQHEAALRHLGNKLIGQLDYCLRHRVSYNENTAWPSTSTTPAA